MGVVADLVQATVWVFLAPTLYQLLKHVHQSAAFAMVVLVIGVKTVKPDEGIPTAAAAAGV